MFLHLSVIQFTGGLCPGLSSFGGSLFGGSLSRGSLPMGVSAHGGLCPGVVSVRETPRTVKSGHSYWNAFFLSRCFSFSFF